MHTAVQRVEPHLPIAEEDRVRANLYAILARLFVSPPDEPFFRDLAQADEMVEEGTAGALPRAWNQLCLAARTCGLDAAQHEYDALFVAIGKPRVTLAASYYLTGFMMERPLAELRDHLARLGLARSGAVSESEDHIGTLAETMRYLIMDETRGPAERLLDEKELFYRHIEPWYGKLVLAIETAEEAHFYRCAAQVLHRFLELEAESFQIGGI